MVFKSCKVGPVGGSPLHMQELNTSSVDLGKSLAELNQSVALYRDLVRHLRSAEDALGLSVRQRLKVLLPKCFLQVDSIHKSLSKAKINGRNMKLGQLRFFLNLCQLLRDEYENLLESSSASTNVAIVENLTIDDPGFSCGVSTPEFYNILVEVEEMVDELKHQNAKLKMKIERRDAEMEEMTDMFKTKMDEREEEAKDIRLGMEEMRKDAEKNMKQHSPRESTYMTCAYKEKWDTPNNIITYDRLSVTSGYEGRIDITSGIFEARTAGYYTISYSGSAVMAPGEWVDIHMMHNNQPYMEGYWWSFADSSNSGEIYDQGSRTVIIYLAAGDIIHLASDITYFTGNIQILTFCAFLSF